MFRKVGWKTAVVNGTPEIRRGGSAGTNWPACSAVDADSFMGRLREKTRLAFDLPTEAQWEYAGRAGRGTDFNTGWNMLSSDGDRDERLDEAGRYLYNGGRPARSSGDGGCEEGTAEVGTYEPNAWGSTTSTATSGNCVWIGTGTAR